MSVITHIGTAVPAYCNQQSDIRDFMLGISQASDYEKRRLRLMYAKSGIDQRYSVVKDYACDINERTFFPKTQDLEPFPSVEKRMGIYAENATKLGVSAFEDAGIGTDYSSITHLISVSCTGMSAPGLDVSLVESLGLSPEIVRTSVNFMGCYAAIHALKLADAFCKSEANAKVLIVLVELCTLHFQKEDTLDYQMSNLLFGDGAAACLVQNHGEGFDITSFYSKLYLEAQDTMAWHISSTGFLMSLKTEVPEVVEQNIKEFVESALHKSGQKISDIDAWAIHPGGRKIVEATGKALALNAADLGESYGVLKDFGNMSSCTLVFILKRMMAKSAKKVFVAGFGPGITMESISLQKIG